jgi:hypothetical protein
VSVHAFAANCSSPFMALVAMLAAVDHAADGDGIAFLEAW